jgi:hypothetical protein
VVGPYARRRRSARGGRRTKRRTRATRTPDTRWGAKATREGPVTVWGP